MRESENVLPFSFKYYSLKEKISWIECHYNLDSYSMAKKITWILTGDCARQYQICRELGPEYAMCNCILNIGCKK